jgi:hypothetical protein
MSEHIMTIVVDGNNVADTEKYFLRVIGKACTCRRHKWDFWRKNEKCAMATATIRECANITVEQILDLVDELDAASDAIDALDSHHAGKFEAVILLRDAAAHARGAAAELESANITLARAL